MKQDAIFKNNCIIHTLMSGIINKWGKCYSHRTSNLLCFNSPFKNFVAIKFLFQIYRSSKTESMLGKLSVLFFISTSKVLKRKLLMLNYHRNINYQHQIWQFLFTPFCIGTVEMQNLGEKIMNIDWSEF